VLPKKSGCFVAVVGPSGAGKDTLLKIAAARLAGHRRIHFVRRIITRRSDRETEVHDTMDVETFEAARAADAFALSWEAHGLHYALPRLALQKVVEGNIVVANISRRQLDAAQRTFGALGIVEITARPEILAARLRARGREAPQDVGMRLARCVDLRPPAGTIKHVKIDNSGPADAAGAQFEALILSCLALLDTCTHRDSEADCD
jgi:ribose 1,5-bisphosphokinase